MKKRLIDGNIFGSQNIRKLKINNLNFIEDNKKITILPKSNSCKFLSFNNHAKDVISKKLYYDEQDHNKKESNLFFKSKE